jgi:hypothetical protein
VSAVTENKKSVSRMPGGKGMKQILPSLAAVGGACSIVAGPAFALELGELTVESKLGQPLRASIAYALQPHEQLHDYCIALKSGPTVNGLPGLSRAAISVKDNAIRLTGSIPILEPMLGLQLLVNCPYTPKLQREYAMFFDRGAPAQQLPAEDESASRKPAPATKASESKPPVSASKPRTATAAVNTAGKPIVAASRYLVQPGDSLSAIVARISDRPAGLWPAVQVVFEANPQAFINGDVDLIRAGSWLTIPDLYQALGQNAAPVVTEESAPAISPVADAAESYAGPASRPLPAASNSNSAFVERSQTGADVIAERQTPSNESAATAAPASVEREGSELRPGDILLGDDNPFVSPIQRDSSDTAASAPTVIIPDTSIPNSAVPVRSLNPQLESQDASGTTSRSWSWLGWLGGAGVAVFLGLLLFGRRIREKFGSAPIGDIPASIPQRRHDERERRVAAPVDVDFAFDGGISDVPLMSLDADLGLGTGLRRSSDIDVAQDFGFSTRHDFAREIDLELPAVAVDEPEQQTTDIIPPHRIAEPSILDSEIPPSEEDDEYDLSMIVDATRQPIVDTHLTAKDLKAVPVGMADDDEDASEYTLSREIDYKILEQDYQEEFTTTQALNEEMAKAALELAHSMSGNIPPDQTAELPRKSRAASVASDRTAELPGSAELEITAELTGNLLASGDAVNDDLINDLDDTGVNEELTAELPHGDQDVTAEMVIEGARIDTKKTRVS